MAQYIENLELRLMNEETAYCIMYPNVRSLLVDQGLHLDTLGKKNNILLTPISREFDEMHFSFYIYML